MNHLFIDCDDTLVLWIYEEKTIAGQLFFTLPNEGEKYRVNHQLILTITDYLARNPNTTPVIWSGGGLEYAAGWARKFFPSTHMLVESKNVNYPRPGDICIDDQKLALAKGVLLYTWQEFCDAQALPRPTSTDE